MLHFRYIRVAPTSEGGWRLQFLLRGTRPGLELVFERSAGPEGPWDEVGTAPWNAVVFDDPIYVRSLSQRFFWRITLLDISGPTPVRLIRTVAVTVGTERSRILAEAIRQHEYQLRYFNQSRTGPGRFFACFKRGSHTTPCDICVDPITGEQFLDDCPRCMGTKRIDGWMLPVRFPGYFTQPFVHSTEHGITGKSVELTNNVCTAAWPILEEGDVLVERWTNAIWEITSVTATEPEGIVVSQNAQVRALPRDFVEHQLVYPEET